MIMNFSYILFLLTGVVSALSERRICDASFEMSCDDGYCVESMRWCDSVVDCPDGSDESYCDLGVPLVQAYEGQVPETELLIHFGVNTTRDAVVKAAEYLIGKKDSDNGWDSFTPRAIVALAFANRMSPIEGMELLKKQLNIRLLLDLMQNQNTLSLSNLALYINALFATCQDPRNFQGIDLVARLREDTDAASRSNSSIPLAFLTLCIADERKSTDAYTLANMYSSQEFQRTGSKALIVMAMICYAKKEIRSFRSRLDDFFFNNRPVTADVYSKALFMQASIAFETPVPLQELLREQFSDGSFGDMLATYYAIPVLVNSSLLDLKCNGTTDIVAENTLKGSENRVLYSLWISTGTGTDVKSNTQTITFDGNKTLFEIMLIAAARDPLYRFQYDEVNGQKRVYSIAGIPNDAESGRSWVLYRGHINNVRVNSVQNLQVLPIDVSNIQAQNNEHFIFWLQRDLRS